MVGRNAQVRFGPEGDMQKSATGASSRDYAVSTPDACRCADMDAGTNAIAGGKGPNNNRLAELFANS